MDLAPSPGPPEPFRVVIPVAELARQAAAHLTRRLDNPRLSPEHLMLKPVITGPPGPALTRTADRIRPSRNRNNNKEKK